MKNKIRIFLMKKRSWISVLLMLLISSIVIYLTYISIDSQYMWSDEIYSFNAGTMILEKGQPLYDSGLYYDRASLYHRLLALSMKFFGVNEFGSRILNIPFLIGIAILVGIFVNELTKNLKTKSRLWISYLSGLFYYISNFSIAMGRETRMYAMSTFLFTLSVWLIYKTFINPFKRGLVRIKWLDLELNVFTLLLTIPVFYIAYQTQPINILLGLGVVLFFFINALTNKKKRKQFLVVLIFLILGLAYTFHYFDHLNIIEIFNTLSPDWATSLNPLYYSVLTVRNLPFIFLILPLTIYYLIRKYDSVLIYLSSIMFTLWGFLSLQSAQHERYWQNFIPLLVILSVYVVTVFLNETKKKNLKIFIYLLLSIFSIFHIYLSYKEYTEIDTYTRTSIGIHKKLEFNSLFDYFDNILNEDDILVADFHSAYTLYGKGYNIDYLLLPDDDVNTRWGDYDLYFDIPIVKESELGGILDGNSGYIVIRDYDRFNEIKEDIVEEFKRPEVYKF